MKLVIQTQYMENYGSKESPYWKSKGGDQYVVDNFDPDIEDPNGDMAIGEVADLIEYSNPMSYEYIISWSVEKDDYLTDFEKNQLEFDGFIEEYSPRVSPYPFT